MVEKDAVGILEFCQRHGLSRSTFYNLEKIGRAPKVMRLGAKIMVSKEAMADWRSSIEQKPIEHSRGGWRRRKGHSSRPWR